MPAGVDKVVASAVDAVADVAAGSSLAVGGFGLCGVPTTLISALHTAGVGDLRVVSNNCGVDDWGLGILLSDHRISRITASYVGENKEFARQYLAGELEVELVPQGTLAERLRAGGCGIPAFFTPAGVGTPVADGGIPLRYGSDGQPEVMSPAKETRRFDVFGADLKYALERAIVCDVGLVRAWKGDRAGNLVYRRSARNFNPLCAMAGRVTIAEVEHLVGTGELDPDEIDTPGVFVHRVVQVPTTDEKRIERRTTRPAP